MGVLPWLLALCCGIALAPFGSYFPWFQLLPPGFALAVFCARGRKMSEAAAVFAFFFSLGYLLCTLAQNPPGAPDHVLRWADGDAVAVEGEVIAVARRGTGGGNIDLNCERLWLEGQGRGVRGVLRLYHQGGQEEVLPGDRLRFRARLRRPRNFGTPGEFDFARYLAARDIWVTAFAPSLDEVAILPGSPGWSPRTLVGRLRHRVAQELDAVLPPDTSALMASLLIGDKGRLSPAQREVLAAGGISHLFSISGLHLGLIAFYAYHLLLVFWRRSERLLLNYPPRRFLPLAVIPVLLAYLLLTGEALPTRRAFFMAVAGALLWLGSRRSAPLHLVASAAFLFLLAEPLLLFEASFQLSFAGVVGIVLLVPRWSGLVPRRPAVLRWLLLLALTTLAATLATLPLTLLHFHTVAPAGLVANLAAVPVVGLVAVPLGLAALALIPVWGAAAGALLGLVGTAVQAVFSGVRWLTEVPALAGRTLFLTPVELAVIALLIMIIFLPGWSKKQLWRRGGALLLGGLVLLLPRPPSENLTVTALSVGQGDSFLLSLGRDRHILIDGGGLYSDTFDVGERLVAPALGHLGVKRLEAVVLTHDHPDHRKGLPYILENFPVGEFWISDFPPRHSFDFTRRPSANSGMSIRHFEAGWTVFEEGSPWTLAVFQPQGADLQENDRSLVVFAGLGEEGVLLTGDLEKKGVNDLLLHPPVGRISLLKLPHHGSAHAFAGRLMDRYEPQAAFVSSGRNNPHGLPAPGVVDELQRRGIPLWRTDEQGSLRFVTSGNRWTIQVWRQGRFQ